MKILHSTAGWKRVTLKAEWLLIGVFLLLAAFPSSTRGEDAVSFPDMALLEFLGSWETEKGEWIDPMLFRDAQVDGVRMSEESGDPQEPKAQADRTEVEDLSPEKKNDKGNMSDD